MQLHKAQQQRQDGNKMKQQSSSLSAIKRRMTLAEGTRTLEVWFMVYGTIQYRMIGHLGRCSLSQR
eukprot:scaffold6518_cov147-Amphora_coffeaeformis.AAC.4